MENQEIIKPTRTPKEQQGDIKAWFKKYGGKEHAVKLFDSLVTALKDFDAEIFYKVGDRVVSFSCPERAFLFIFPRKEMLRMNIFTGGKTLGGVKQFKFERGAEKWGGLSISNEREFKKALPWIRESVRRIRLAIKQNQPTGWYAKLDADGG